MRILPRSTPAVVLAVAALMILSTTGGAVAGALITSKDIKDGTVASVDIKDHTITKADIAASAQGLQGAPGKAGAPGPRGYSAWDTIPSGQTVTGEIYFDASTTGSNATDRFWVSLPGRAPVNLVETTVNFAPSGFAVDDDPACTGSTTAPTAPSGRVCIYLSETHGATGLLGSPALLRNAGFYVQWSPVDASAGLDLYFEATWAYTAP